VTGYTRDLAHILNAGFGDIAERAGP